MMIMMVLLIMMMMTMMLIGLIIFTIIGIKICIRSRTLRNPRQ